jgi:hypothetical protein
VARARSGYRFLAELHAAASAERSGVLWLTQTSSTALRVEFVRGWVHAFTPLRRDADDDERLKLRRAGPPLDAEQAFLAELMSRATGTDAELVDDDEPRQRLGAVPPFHPARALRRAAAALLASVEDDASIDAQLAGTLALSLRVHGSAIDPDERSIITLLESVRLGMDDLVARSRCTPPRARALLRELALLGALTADERPIALDLVALRIAAEARAAERRREYHAAARRVHPDLHPDDDETERAEHNAQMADLAHRHKR